MQQSPSGADTGFHALIDFSAGPPELSPIRAAFAAPCREILAWSVSEVEGALREVEALAQEGFWCVGYLRYEAAPAFEPSAAVHPADGPLVYFSIHREALDLPALHAQPGQPVRWSPTLGRAAFDEGMGAIHRAIADGEVYQVNYTSPLVADYRGDTFALFCSLRRAQPNANAAYIAGSHEHVLSVSPELFFDWDGRTLCCEPMKGTAPRGRTPEADQQNALELARSEKERAENLMIVDLLRNDLSRLAELGSVRVPRLFECRAWPTVWQMTSQVQAQTREGTSLADIFRALFPCGSITGAPKLRAMHWIRRLEPAPRGVYCGAVGVVAPGGAARFNVPIRTVTVKGGSATCSIGSGITADASCENEWQEWRHKALFLDRAGEGFSLLQTMRFQDGAWRDLLLHLERLGRAAAEFGFSFDRSGVVALLEEQAAALRRGGRDGRVRLTVAPDGTAHVDIAELPEPARGVQPVELAPRPIEAPFAFLRHKTTRRAHYEAFAPQGTAFDTLLWNDAGEVTEFTRGNVIIERASGELVTPALACGLLDGVGRARALASGHVKEAVVRVDELASARRIWFVNSLRGRIPVQLTQVALMSSLRISSGNSAMSRATVSAITEGGPPTSSQP